MAGDGGEEDLQALLKDGDLTNVPSEARVATGIGQLPDGGVVSQPDAGSGPPPSGATFGQWTFDDCNDFRTQLADSTFNGNTAFRSVGVTCTAGIRGSAVELAVKEDIVYVPDQPNFTFENGLTAAAWVKPTAVGGTRTILRKRDQGTSAFALLLNGGKFQMVIDLGGGRAISVTSPQKAKANVFQHVAATYDNQTLRLYVDGLEVTNFPLAGAIPPGPGPLLIGNDGSERRMNGAIDEPLFAGRALSAAEILQLNCFPVQPVVVATPTISDPTPAGSPATFDVAITNANPAKCAPLDLTAQIFPGGPVQTDPPLFVSTELAPIPSGTTGHFIFTATADPDTEPGTLIDLFVQIFDAAGLFQGFANVTLQVAEPAGCHVSRPRELFVTNPLVVDDPVRTNDPIRAPIGDGRGAWTFKRLMENLAPTPEDAPAMVEAMFQTLTTTQTVNGFVIGPRPNAQIGLDQWPRTADGQLDLAQAPVRLDAIVNRFDLRNLANGDAGEGRFVFGFQLGGFPLQASIIFEYKLPATTDTDVLGWAQAFHALGALPFGEDYNDALEAVTNRFTDRGARPGAVNGSALSVIRTNEIDFGDNGIWQMREFHLSPTTGLVEPRTLELTPDQSFNNSDALAGFINANEPAILAETHTVPDTLDGQPFAAGAVFTDFSVWNAPGITNPEARFHFGLNTCNGCHSTETGTNFQHVIGRVTGSESSLSGFLVGTTVFDPFTGTVRTFGDLARRGADLAAIVCDGNPAKLRRGISRVH